MNKQQFMKKWDWLPLKLEDAGYVISHNSPSGWSEEGAQLFMEELWVDAHFGDCDSGCTEEMENE